MSNPRAALVTGASRGIGRVVALELSRRGVRVFASGRDLAQLESLHEDSGCSFSVRDLARPEEVTQLYEEAKACFGEAPDILVNNAGFSSKSAIVDASLEEFERLYAVNLRAPFLLCREAGRDMRTRGSGHIVNVLSTCALFSNENLGLYTAMKAGLRDLTKILAKELRTAGVKVTSVYPGGVDTEFRPNARPDYLRPESAGRLIVDTLFAPEDAVIHELVFRPMCESNF